MFNSKNSRGKNRLLDIMALPYIDCGSDVKYEGSISKCGDNADWDWGLYQDDKGEWVLMEADGAGCIYNITQHRYPTSEIPTFKFYFDNSDVPQFEITPAEFGIKSPFLRPLADKFVGPEDGGRGPIWVIRSFVPMEFCSHCKVTSTVKLEGCEKSLGQGGWGHITYQLYDSPDGLKTFDPNDDISELVELYKNGIAPIFNNEIKLQNTEFSAKSSSVVAKMDNSANITEIKAELSGFAPIMLSGLWVKIYFDGTEKPYVEAPFGTFFGCEYGERPADISTCILTSNFSGDTAVFSNRFPMPFRYNAEVVIENRLESAVTFKSITVLTDDTVEYDFDNIGYFTSSKYYPLTGNKMGKNSVIADVYGSGHMVYGVLTAKKIIKGCGCEGDVRVFIDGISSPCIESDGSESWASYGWGFVLPPQCNPFSSYNGVYMANDTWSELRITLGDSYNFRSNIRFELEHAEYNNGGGFHSGQIFMYMRPETKEKLICEIEPNSSCYSTDGEKEEIHNRFENGIHENYLDFTCVGNMTYSEFKIKIPSDNKGIVLKRTSMQNKGRMAAEVYIDGTIVEEKQWLFADSNTIFSLLDDNFIVPAKYTEGKNNVIVRIVPQDKNWTECKYRIYKLI